MTYVKYSLNTSSLRPINVAFAKPDPIYWPAKQSNIKEKRRITLEGNPSQYESVYSELPREFS